MHSELSSFWQEKVTIGSLKVPRFIGGPLDGITDSPFRRLVREFSQDELLYTEMRHVACIANDAGGTKALHFYQPERPLNFQIAANEIQFIEQAIDKILHKGVDSIDLNIGCPARNVVRSGTGSALMADLPRLKEILCCLREKIPLPFTVKIRTGLKKPNAVDVAKLAQDCGIDALAIHPRLQTQRFEGRPDYATAAAVKKAVDIPVFISGGIVNFKLAQLVYDQTGVDGFLVARGMWAKPWKLKELAAHAAGKPFEVDNKLILSCALKHFDYMLKHYGDHAIFMFRKHLPFYIRGVLEAAVVRKRLVLSTSVDEVKQGLTQILG